MELTANVGIRFDRYASSLPEQGNPGTGPFSTKNIYPTRHDFPISQVPALMCCACARSSVCSFATSAVVFGALWRDGGLPIATGENLHTLHEFKQMIEAGGVTFPEPDVTNCGGITVFMKVAHLAEAYNLPNHTQFSSYSITPSYDWRNWLQGRLVQTRMRWRPTWCWCSRS